MATTIKNQATEVRRFGTDQLYNVSFPKGGGRSQHHLYHTNTQYHINLIPRPQSSFPYHLQHGKVEATLIQPSYILPSLTPPHPHTVILLTSSACSNDIRIYTCHVVCVAAWCVTPARICLALKCVACIIRPQADSLYFDKTND